MGVGLMLETTGVRSSDPGGRDSMAERKDRHLLWHMSVQIPTCVLRGLLTFLWWRRMGLKFMGMQRCRWIERAHHSS